MFSRMMIFVERHEHLNRNRDLAGSVIENRVGDSTGNVYEYADGDMACSGRIGNNADAYGNADARTAGPTALANDDVRVATGED